VTAFGEELSSREVAVLQLAAEGLTQREIADQLFISYNTVKSHLKATYRKLGATSRDDALTRWADLEVIVPPS
jgi:LuxR family maltose regulon positive regulatory protein